VIGHLLDGRYAITKLLGRGGMGVVYLATDRDAGTDVVIKMISPALRYDDETVARFHREARRLRGLDHPNIVRFLDSGHEGDLSYLVMEYIDGELLTNVLRRQGRLSYVEFVPIAAQILKGVGHAHSRDVLLRDIKPSNIMLCERKGRTSFVKLLDFGLAKIQQGELPITTAHVLGPAGYIAPEVLRGATLDLRVDVYALGALFYLLLSGRPPFEAVDQAAVFTQTLHEVPPPLIGLSVDRAAPAGLLELVHLCLEKDPDRRPTDANQVIEELIDVVPAMLFRLPRIGESGRGHVDTQSYSVIGGDHDGSPLTNSTEFRSLGQNAPVTEPFESEPHAIEDRDHARAGVGVRENTDRVQTEFAPSSRDDGRPSSSGSVRSHARSGLGARLGAALLGGSLGIALASVVLVAVLGGDGRSLEEPVAIAKATMQPTHAVTVVSPPPVETAVPSVPPSVVAASQTLPPPPSVLDPRGIVAARFREAEKAAATGDYVAAIDAYVDVLEIDPGHELAKSGLERIRATITPRGARPRPKSMKVGPSSNPPESADADPRAASDRSEGSGSKRELMLSPGTLPQNRSPTRTGALLPLE